MGLQLSPRIRNLGKITLYRTGPGAGFLARYPSPTHRRLDSGLIGRRPGRPPGIDSLTVESATISWAVCVFGLAQDARRLR